MTRAKLIVLISFLVAFAAGAAAGLAIGRAPRPRPDRSWLGRELNLTAAQQEQMHAVWADVMSAGGQRRAAIQTERDEDIHALLTPEQQVRYDEILKEHAQKLEVMAQERQRLFQEAQQKTRAILTDEQRKKYDEMMKRRGPESTRRRRGGPGGPGGPGEPEGPADRGVPGGPGGPRGLQPELSHTDGSTRTR